MAINSAELLQLDDALAVNWAQFQVFLVGKWAEIYIIYKKNL